VGAGVGGGTGGVGNGSNAPQLQVPPLLHLHCVEKLSNAQTNPSRSQLDPPVGLLSGVQYDSIGGGAQYSLGSGANGLSSCIEREEIETFPSMMMMLLPLSELLLDLPISIAFAMMICSAKAAALARTIK